MPRTSSLRAPDREAAAIFAAGWLSIDGPVKPPQRTQVLLFMGNERRNDKYRHPIDYRVRLGYYHTERGKWIMRTGAMDQETKALHPTHYMLIGESPNV